MVVKRGLRNATFYLATSLEADVVYILSMKDTIAQSEVYKALYCLGFTYKCLTLTWAFLAARHLAEPRSIGVLQDILGAMQEAVSEERDAFVWMEEATRNKTAAALSKLSVHVIAGKAFNVTSVDYNKPDVKLDVDENFLKVLVTALKLHHSVMSAKPPTRVEMLVSELEFRGALSLIPIMEYIVVPTLYQRDPYLYNYHVPDYFNYGTMGGLLGAQLAETVGVAVNDDRQSTWDPATATKHGELLRCLTERRRHLGFPDFHPATADQQQTQMVTLSISARLAYSGLKRVFRRKGLQSLEPPILKLSNISLTLLVTSDCVSLRVFSQSRTVKVFNDYWPEALRVFFSRFCLLWCSGSQAADPLTAREKCVLPLYNMEEFAELYNCDANSTGGAVCPT
ncbi:hypothetical protein V5799_008523 [Amblyomma americanum]|uniref:Uncharacterized protein n=1 Tax=Amblyomma americanum TaxID=6943 RepID=A0AAQ4FEM8_AMBAM